MNSNTQGEEDHQLNSMANENMSNRMKKKLKQQERAEKQQQQITRGWGKKSE